MRPLLALAPLVPRIAASAGIARRLDRPRPTLTFDDGPHPEGTPQRIAARATRALGPGDVILLHDADHYSSKDSWQRTLAALPEILAAAQPTGSGSESTSIGVSAASQPK